jgi:hypothetical protein
LFAGESLSNGEEYAVVVSSNEIRDSRIKQVKFVTAFLQRRAMMEFEGTVRNGVIVMDNAEALPEGARVRVHLEEKEPKPTLSALLKHSGVLTDMPADFAEQHDHYIHGTPKR